MTILLTKISDDATCILVHEELEHGRVMTIIARGVRRKAMKQFTIEHIGLLVQEPVNMARWYNEVLGFHIQLSSQHDDAEKSVAFVTDAHDNVMLEFGKLPAISPISN